MVDWAMTHIMHFLVDTFGFRIAVEIKDSTDLVGGILIGLLILASLWGYLDTKTTQNENLEKGLIVLKAVDPESGATAIFVNPKTSGEAIVAKIGALLILLFPNKKFQKRRIQNITLIILFTIIFLTIILLIASFWVTPESFDHGSKKVSYLTSLNYPSNEDPIHFQLSSLTSNPGLGNKE